MQKEIFVFEKNILTCNFTPTPFDELKHTPERYFVSPFFLLALQKQFSHGMILVIAFLII